MARPFGGRYSPGATPPTRRPRRPRPRARRWPRRAAVDAAGARANLIFVPAVVAAAFGLFGGPASLLLSLGAAAVLALVAGPPARGAAGRGRLPRPPRRPPPGPAPQDHGRAPRPAAAPRSPRSRATRARGALLYGIAAGGLHLAAFGLDPMRDKRMEGIDTFQQDRVARVAAEAEAYLADMRDAVSRLGDRALDARVAGFDALARRMIRSVEEDPRDLTGARQVADRLPDGRARRLAEVRGPLRPHPRRAGARPTTRRCCRTCRRTSRSGRKRC